MKIKRAYLFFFGLITSYSALAIEPTYEGVDGIRVNVFETNCLSCHSSELSGLDRNDAPFSVNFDSYEAALINAEDAIKEAIDERAMPPIESGIPFLTQEQQDALLAWQVAGFPISERSTYDFVTQRLNLPVVNVGNITYSAVLQLFLTDQSPFGFGFELISAAVTNQTSDSAAVFDSQTGEVNLPVVDLFDGTNTTNSISAQMQLIDDQSLQFIVTSTQ